MPPFPGEPDQGRLNEIVRRLNQEQPGNGKPPVLPPGVKPRASGWRCPKCGRMAEQRIEPAPGTVLGYRWIVLEDGKPWPVNVMAGEVLERDEQGNVVRDYRTMHCVNCFNAWQRRKMMEELRANVPQLVWEGVPDAATDPHP